MCLWNLEGCDFSQRQLLCGGEVYFGSLPPGAYGLALCGGEETQALELRLPPRSQCVRDAVRRERGIHLAAGMVAFQPKSPLKWKWFGRGREVPARLPQNLSHKNAIGT